MSVLFQDVDVEVVKIVAKRRDGSSSTTLYVAQEFWPSGALYTSSPVCYPLLAESPSAARACGTNVAVRANVSIKLLAHTPSLSVNNTFADMLSTHDFHGASVTLYYYPKPEDAAVTDGASNIRQTLEVVSIDHAVNDNYISINCRDTWFGDKEFSRRFNASNFNNTNSLNRWFGEYGSIVFGDSADGVQGVISSNCPISGTTVGGTDDITPIVGFRVNSSSDMNYLPRSVYVRNQFKDLDPKEYLQCGFSIATQAYNGPTSFAGSPTAWPAWQWRMGSLISPSVAEPITGVTVLCKAVGTINNEKGQFQVSVRRAIDMGSGQLTAVGNVLAQASYDVRLLNTITTTNALFYFASPFIPVPGYKYLFFVEWTNSTDTANYVQIYYDTLITSNPVYTNDQTVNREGWKQTAAQLQMSIWGTAKGSTVSTGLTDGTYTLIGQELTPNQPGGNVSCDWSPVEFKIGTYIQTGTTYGGGVGTEFSNPAAIIKFVLMDTVMGLGLVDGVGVDATAINSVRSTIGTGLPLGFALESEISCGEFIAELCRQSRLRFYKTRAGLMTLNFPTPIGSTFDADLSESAYQADLQVIAIRESEESELVNFVDAVYGPDALNINSDPVRNRRAKDSRFVGQEYVHPGATGDSVSDSFRGSAATASQSLYGVRSALWQFPFHNRASTARKVLNYYVDRYGTARRKVAVRVLRRQWYNVLDLFSKVRIRHSLIPTELGNRSEDPGHAHDGAGTEQYCWEDGVRLRLFADGSISGEVLEIAEEGPYMTLTIETMNSFEGYV